MKPERKEIGRALAEFRRATECMAIGDLGEAQRLLDSLSRPAAPASTLLRLVATQAAVTRELLAEAPATAEGDDLLVIKFGFRCRLFALAHGRFGFRGFHEAGDPSQLADEATIRRRLESDETIDVFYPPPRPEPAIGDNQSRLFKDPEIPGAENALRLLRRFGGLGWSERTRARAAHRLQMRLSPFYQVSGVIDWFEKRPPRLEELTRIVSTVLERLAPPTGPASSSGTRRGRGR